MIVTVPERLVREVHEGSRDSLIAKLQQESVGWWHLGNDELSREARQAVLELEAGSSAVQVGHTWYEVTDG